MTDNPFKSTYGYWTDAESRLHCVKSFDADQCRAALEVNGLQKTVTLALERRLRALARASNHDDVQDAAAGER